jgi:hypothetical protein
MPHIPIIDEASVYELIYRFSNGEDHLIRIKQRIIYIYALDGKTVKERIWLDYYKEKNS